MTKTGPQKYPGASTAYWFQGKYGGSAMESNVGIVHTTEGASVPSYSGGSVAPNFTASPDFKNQRLVWYQHFDFDTSSRALVNLAGGVETNTANAVQIELVGTCDPAHRIGWSGLKAGLHYLYWPDAPDWALRELAKFVKWAHDQHGIRLASTVAWKAYPGSYGASNGVRLSGAAWDGYYGWLGHQHVPENLHGDPGDLDMAKVLAFASGTPTTPTAPTPAAPTEDSDMPTELISAGNPDMEHASGAVVRLEFGDGKTAIAAGPCHYDVDVNLYLAGVPAGGQVQGRFLHVKGTTVKAGPIAEAVATDGQTFCQFSKKGSLAAGESLQFQAQALPGTAADPAFTYKSTYRLAQGLVWKD